MEGKIESDALRQLFDKYMSADGARLGYGVASCFFLHSTSGAGLIRRAISPFCFCHRASFSSKLIGWRDVKKIVKTRTPIGYGYYSGKFQVCADGYSER